MFSTAAEIEASLISAGLSDEDARALADASKPGVWLHTRTAGESEIPIGATKIGGRPDLPEDAESPIRPLYPDAVARTAQYRKDAERPDSWWKAATQERKDACRAGAANGDRLKAGAAFFRRAVQFPSAVGGGAA